MPEPWTVPSFAALLQVFAPCFTAPSFASFVALCHGWLVCLERHTVTGVARALGPRAGKSLSALHRFYGRGRWSAHALFAALWPLLDRLLPEGGEVRLVLDDVLCKHRGPKVFWAQVARDPLGLRSKSFEKGHVWVVLTVVLEAFGKRWALPVGCRLYRPLAACAEAGVTFRTESELGRELVEGAARALPRRRLLLAADAAYVNRALVRERPTNVHLVGRGRLDAALRAERPRGARGGTKYGPKLPSPKQAAEAEGAPFAPARLTVYGKRAEVEVLDFVAYWPKAALTERVRFLVVRGFPGRKAGELDVLLTTDLGRPAAELIEAYSYRWPIEPTFRECKQRLGLSEPQARSARAVERQAPLVLLSYSLLVLWYVRAGQHLPGAAPARRGRKAAEVTFGHMLATFRTAAWRGLLGARRADGTTCDHELEPLLRALAHAA